MISDPIAVIDQSESSTQQYNLSHQNVNNLAKLLTNVSHIMVVSSHAHILYLLYFWIMLIIIFGAAKFKDILEYLTEAKKV